MERERFESLIIDYLEGNLSRQEEEEFLSAMTEHDEYREIYDHYLSIRSVIKTEEDVSPNPEILKSISDYAKEDVKKENPSVLKKWFTLPILAPLLGSAIIAVFWFSVGEEYLRNKYIINVTEIGNEKGSGKSSQLDSYESKRASEAVIAEEQNIDFRNNNIRAEDADELDALTSAPSSISGETEPGNNDRYRDDTPYLQSEQEDVISDDEGSSSLARSPKVPEPEAAGFSYKQSKDDLQADTGKVSELNVSLEEAVENRPEKRSLKKESVGAKVAATKPKSSSAPVDSIDGSGEYFREQINNVLAQQYQGDCVNSIKTSNQILNADPEPPKSVKTTLYLSQAECYEELNEIDNAIKAYEKVQQIEPSSTSFFSGKIRQLNMKKAR